MTNEERKVFELALEALEEAWYHVGTFQPTEKAIDLYDEARAAIKEALAQPEHEPVAVVDVHEFYDNCANFSLLQKLPKGKHTLYTAPPQRTWVGLTDDELNMIGDSMRTWNSWTITDVYFAIEAKLKEKNNA